MRTRTETTATVREFCEYARTVNLVPHQSYWHMGISRATLEHENGNRVIIGESPDGFTYARADAIHRHKKLIETRKNRSAR